MNRLWNVLVRPILEEINAQYIVETGTDLGLNTKNILEYCVDNNAHLTIIDPLPKFDINKLKEEYDDIFEIYTELSSDRLQLLKDYDAIFIKGYHNHDTIYNELKTIEKSFKTNKFPIIFLCGPKTEITPSSDRSTQLDISTDPNNIIDEDNMNGIIEAADDFIKESSLNLSFRYINASNGLGIIYVTDKELDNTVEKIIESPDLIDILEKERIELKIIANNLTVQNNDLESTLSDDTAKLNHLKNELNKTDNKLKETETKLDQTNTRLNLVESELQETGSRLLFLNKKFSRMTSNDELVKELSNNVDYIERDIAEMNYRNNYGRSIKQRLMSRFTILYLFLKGKSNIKSSIINIKGYRAIKKNHLFDVGYYLKSNIDVMEMGKDPFIHYLYHGFEENRNPNPDFDGDYYLQSNIDVLKLKINPLIHYSLYGMKEGRKTKELDEYEQVGTRISVTKRKRLEEKYGVSVIMPTYNRVDIVGRAIDSVLQQTFDHLELIVIDDGSTDDTESLITEKYAEHIKNGKIKYIKQENSGVNIARNTGLANATGSIIAYLDSDNYWLDTYLEKMVGALVDNKCNTAYAAMDVDDKYRNRKFIRETKYNRNELLKGNFIDLNIFVHKKFLYDQLGGFNESLNRLVDWDLILRYTRLNEPFFVDQVLAKYFLSDDLKNISNTVDLGENQSKVYKLHSDERVEKGIESLNIGYVLWDFPAFSQTFVMNELRWLVENNYDVKVFYKIKPDREAELDFEIDSVQIKNATDLIRRIDEYKINMLHTHFSYPAGTRLTYPAAVKTGTPFTLSAHAIDIFHKKNDKKNKIGEMGRSEYCRKIFVPGKFHHDYLVERGVPAEKLMSLRQATKYDIYGDLSIDSPRFDRKIKNVITIARFIEKKGIDTLIKAAKILEKEDLIFRIYGYGPLEKDLKNLIKKLDLDNVVFEGSIEGNDALKKTYQEGDIFALPCRRAPDGDMDGVPTVIFESMAYGIPVITTNVSSIPEFILNDYYGYVVNPDEPAALAETIMKVKNLEKHELHTVLKRAQNRVKEISSIEETTKTMLDIWKNYRIDIFMVTYQRDQYKDLKTIKEIFDRIFKYTTVEFDLTIVDNNSDEEFTDFIQDYSILHPNIRLILLNENILCGPASNIALERMGHEFAIYVCSNEGMILKPGWEYKALNFMREHKKVAMAGTLAYSPSFYDRKTYKSQKFFENFRNKEYLDNNPNMKLKHIQGGIYILRKEAYDQCGGFNPLLPQNYMDIEYSYYLKSNDWELAEIPEWISLTKKTLPNLNTYLDENTTAAHPLTLNELEQIENRIYPICNICNGRLMDDICSDCGSDSSERAIYRIVGKTDRIYRSLTCTLLLKNNTLHKPFKKMFDLTNKKYSTKNLDNDNEVLPDNLEETDVLITNMTFDEDNLHILQEISKKVTHDGLLIVELSNNELLNNSIKKLLKDNKFIMESVEFVSNNLTDSEILVAERSS